MLDIGPGEFIAIAVIAMIVLGPEKLPRYAAEAARFLRRMRQMATAARADVRRELGPEFDDLRLSELNPRGLVRRHLLEPVELDGLGEDLRPRNGSRPPSRAAGGPRSANRPAPGSRPAGGATGDGSATGSAATPPPFDPDTT